MYLFMGHIPNSAARGTKEWLHAWESTSICSFGNKVSFANFAKAQVGWTLVIILFNLQELLLSFSVIRSLGILAKIGVISDV